MTKRQAKAGIEQMNANEEQTNPHNWKTNKRKEKVVIWILEFHEIDKSKEEQFYL